MGQTKSARSAMTTQPNVRDAKNSVAAKSQTALITGASGGIGCELAKFFARDRTNLILVARSVHKLAEVARELQSRFGCTVKTIALDLGTSTAPKFLFDQLQGEGVTVDILVK